MFMSDNGGNAEAGPKGRTNGDPTEGKSDWFCGESWAFVENTPFRLFKHFNHEGGIATPLIAHWPQRITAKNELRTTPGHLIDIMATCVDVAGAEYPKAFKGHSITPMEGVSLKPLLVSPSESLPIARPLYWEHEGNAAIRVGDEKLVRQGRNGPWELYNLKTDRTELHDLAPSQPDQAKALADKWEAWADRAHVKPYPNEGEGKKKGKGKGKKAK